MNIIALDIDDCILPTDVNYFGRTDDSLDIFEINLKRLKMIIEKYDFKVFITSSWYSLLSLDDNEFRLNSDRNDYLTLMVFGLMKKYIGKYIIGLSCGDRDKDIEYLKQKNKVVILDDWDLTYHNSEDCLFVNMSGFIDGNVGFKIDKFMKKEKNELF
jgi:hypothetical protein